MNPRIGMPLLGILAFTSCAPKSTAPDGAALFDGDITLVREATTDAATREIKVDSDAILVAVVDEHLTDVRLGLMVLGAGENAAKPVEVENHLAGAGREIAVLSIAGGARVRVRIVSGQDALRPGKVHLRVQQFSAAAQNDPKHASRLKALRAWGAGTDAALRARTAKEIVPTVMQQAIDALGAPQDAVLAAESRLIRAAQLAYFKVDWREARAEAQRASAAFAALPQPDAPDAARARYVEALALAAMSGDTESANPTAAEAMRLARQALEALSAPTSALGPIERARAIAVLGQLDVNMMLADAANKHFEEALAIYHTQGYSAGEREMRINLGMVLVEQGRFAEAARAFDELLPQLDLITDPELRVKAYLAAARAQSFSDRTDEGGELMLKALPLAREYQLRDLEATALQGLGYIYQNRGDLSQAGAFLEEALNVARDGNNVAEYVIALASAGAAARANDEMERAFELHKEAVRLAPSPVLQVRTQLDLGVDYYHVQDLPAAIAMYRRALAVDLHDPYHHVFTDGKLGLAQFLIEYEKSTDRDLVEADRLLTEAMKTSVGVQDQWRVIFTTRVRGQLNARRGRAAAARADFERVFALARELRQRSGSIEARSTMLKDEEMAFQGYLDVVLADVAKRGAGVLRTASSDELAGVRRLERARQQSFGALRVGKLDPQTAARVDALLAEMGRKSLQISALVGGNLDATQGAALRALQLDMARLHAELDLVRATAADKLASSPPAADSSLGWRALAPGTAQLSYALGRQHVYVTVRSGAGTRIAVLAPSRKALEKQLADIGRLDMRTSPEKVEAALAEVSSVLLPAGLLPPDSSAVEIVAEGRIAGIPFAAMRSPTDPTRRLVETHDIAMITSLLDVGDGPRTPHARPFQLVALASGSGTYRAATLDPVPALQAATREIDGVAALFKARDPAAAIKLLTGASGSSAALRDIWSSGADVVHFATHALADLRQPIASLLVLPALGPDGKATYLTAGQVQGWRGDTGLVFLSACESAIGPPQFAGGMPGLQRAFLRAGARGVIATLAPIEDVLAEQFAADFYRRYTGGLSAQRALSETQRAWLTPKPGTPAAEQTRRRIMALAHAYFAG